MNKKQLTLQNTSLFAELERKAKEIEILNIRLDEAEKKVNTLSDESTTLKQALEKADTENKNLFEKNKELEAALVEAEAKAAAAFVAISTSNPEAKIEATEIENSQETTELAEPTEEKNQSNELSFTSAESEVAETPEIPTENTVPEAVTPPTAFEVKKPEISLPIDDLLRDYGAKIIGKVTRVTAETLSKINAINDDAAESLKTLALGKNESFKFQIMELAKRKTDPEKTISEMDLLADEAILYLRSI